MNLDAAKSFALDYLIKNIGPEFHYHNMSHTMDVFQSVGILAINENVKPNDLLLLQTAALYHDLGIHKDYFHHEDIAVKLVEEVLPAFDFDREQIKAISKLILDTRYKCVPNSKLGELIGDADLDYLGREDFLEISGRLRKEWEVYEIKHVTDKEWYLYQIDFLNKHEYYTASAKTSRDNGKQKNIDKLGELLINS